MKFSELVLHPALAAALAARGYETATDVQTAVLEPRHAGRDLLVSSQTGSGKTIAFGAAMVETILGGGAKAADPGAGTPEGQEDPDGSTAGEKTVAAPPFVPGGKRPVALVVVPTRELAIQVREELGWLLAQTRLRLGSFTGGTAVSGDLRNLQRGVDVVIGTPGRLVDLLTRERLDLSGLRIVVLDEADEMLDLGFRDDLEALLKAAAPGRRTLLLSATLPAEIRSMARKYQRDAVAIDPRKEAGQSASAPHADIEYVAHLISGHDRLATVVNVLRARAPRRAIVFCTTRDAVSSLHAALVARGFAATAISGERAQTDRDRALGLIRSGQAQVLVATNVAARGLHLPDVELIVHADLPLNAESLTHRSGRTGRAGRKGTAVVIATLTERRKAERLMAIAHVVAPWTPAPTPESITAAARERLVETLLLSGEPGARDPRESEGEGEGEGEAEAEEESLGELEDGAVTGTRARAAGMVAAAAAAPAPEIAAMMDRLEAHLPARELLARLLTRELARLPRGEAVHPVAMPDARDGRGRVFDDRERGRAEGGPFVMFRVNMGAMDKADPKWILPLICRRGDVTRREVGTIRVGPRETSFEIDEAVASRFARAAAETDPRAPQIRFERVASFARPQGAAGDTRASRAPAREVGRPAARFGAPRSTTVPPPATKPGVPAAPDASAAARPKPRTKPAAPRVDREPVVVASPPAASAAPAAPAVPAVSTQLAEAARPARREPPMAMAPLDDAAFVPHSASLDAQGTSEASALASPLPEISSGKKPKRGATAAPVIERKSSPIRHPEVARRTPSGDLGARPAVRPGFPPARAPSATFAPRSGASRIPHRSTTISASPAAAPRTQGGFGPPKRFVAHAMEGRGPAARDTGPGVAAGSTVSRGARGPGRMDRAGAAGAGKEPWLESPAREGRPSAPARSAGFADASPRHKRPPFRPGGTRPDGLSMGKGKSGGAGAGFAGAHPRSGRGGPMSGHPSRRPPGE